MGKRGPKPKDVCVHGHRLDLPGAVAVTIRKRRKADGSIAEYKERVCVKCRRNRNSRWWADNRAK